MLIQRVYQLGENMRIGEPIVLYIHVGFALYFAVYLSEYDGRVLEIKLVQLVCYCRVCFYFLLTACVLVMQYAEVVIFKHTT